MELREPTDCRDHEWSACARPATSRQPWEARNASAAWAGEAGMSESDRSSLSGVPGSSHFSVSLGRSQTHAARLPAESCRSCFEAETSSALSWCMILTDAVLCYVVFTYSSTKPLTDHYFPESSPHIESRFL